MSVQYTGSSVSSTGATQLGYVSDGTANSLSVSVNLSEQPFNLDLADLGSPLTVKAASTWSTTYQLPSGFEKTDVYTVTTSVNFSTSIATFTLSPLSSNNGPAAPYPAAGTAIGFSFTFTYTSL